MPPCSLDSSLLLVQQPSKQMMWVCHSLCGLDDFIHLKERVRIELLYHSVPLDGNKCAWLLLKLSSLISEDLQQYTCPVSHLCLVLVLSVARRAGARDCRLCVPWCSCFFAWKHQHFSDSTGKLSPSNPKSSETKPSCWPVVPVSLFCGAICIVSNFMYC